MFTWLRLVIIPELRAVPVEQHTNLIAAGVLHALTDAHVHMAGLACSLCAGVGAIAGVASTVKSVAFVAVLAASGFAMWRTWKDQHTYS